MIHNLLQSVLLVGYIVICAYVLYQNRTNKFGAVVLSQTNVLANGDQGMETTVGRSCGCDVRVKDPAVSRRQAVIRYDAKRNQFLAWTKSGLVQGENAVPGHPLQFKLSKVALCPYSGLITLTSGGFLGLRMIALYSEYNIYEVLFPFLVLLGYLVFSAVVRSDHTPVAESLLAILLTYYVDAVLYNGSPWDAFTGVVVYTACAALAYLILLVDLSPVHGFLRMLASLAIFGLIVLNLALAENINGAYNWVSVAGVSFQPSEAVKVLLAFVLLTTCRKQECTFANLFFGAIVPGACFIYGLIIRDIGCLLLFGVLYIVSLIIQGGNLLFRVVVVLATLVGAKVILILSSTAAERYLGWRGTETTILGALTASGVFQHPYDYGYQSVNALTAAFPNGGLLGNDTYDVLDGVLAANSDLVTAFLAQKHGWPILFLLVALYGVLLCYTLQTLSQKNKLQQMFSTLSCAVIIAAVVLNMGGTFGVLPLTGIVNPALSDGMSAGVSYGVFFGVIASSALKRTTLKKLKFSIS